MDSDDLIFGAVYQVLLLIQGHFAAEYASCLQSADFTSYQDLVLWHVSIYYNMTTQVAVRSSGILKGKQKLGVAFNFDNLIVYIFATNRTSIKILVFVMNFILCLTCMQQDILTLKNSKL